MVSEYPEAAASAAPAGTPAAEARNNEGLAARATASLELSPREEFVIECLRNARYHEDRERFFARIHRTAMFLVVASGTATFAWVASALPAAPRRPSGSALTRPVAIWQRC